jgi:hypothetical protein
MRGWCKSRRGAGDAGLGGGQGSGEGAHAFAGPGAEDVQDRVLADQVRAVVDGADAEGLGGLLRDGEGPFVQVEMGGFVKPFPGLAAVAEEGGEEGEEDGAQQVVQAHAWQIVQACVASRALGAGMGGALRPAVKEGIHSVSLHR